MYYKNFSKIYDKFMKHCNYDEWSSEIEELIKRYNPDAKNLLDLGCGTGETLIRLKEKFSCEGLDLSEDMLKIAHKKLKNSGVPLFLGDMREFDTRKKYDVIISLFDTVNHLTSLEDLDDLFKSVKNSLNDDGIYIFDVVDRKFMDKMFEKGIYFDDRKDMSIIWEHFQEDDIDVIEATYFVKNRAGFFEKFKEMYEKRIFDRKELEKYCEKNNLSLLSVQKNDRIAGERDFYILKNIK